MDESFPYPRCQALPESLDRTDLLIAGRTHATYNANPGGTRPFVFPLSDDVGNGLTRIGHPNPVGHEHHKSVWFGHQSINGLNFWEEPALSTREIRHDQVRALHDGSDRAGIAVALSWRDGARVLLRQELLLVIEPDEPGSWCLELQSRFEAADEPVQLGQTNFGFLGVRVAKTMSVQFGGGRLLGSDGQEGEPALFGKRNRWVDYTGPVAPRRRAGIAYLDHPANPGHPTPWHVRADGWFCASFNLAGPYLIPPEHPLDLRYRLWIHDDPRDALAINAAWDRFAASPPLTFTNPAPGSPPGLARVQPRP